jgi:hypothetical protein
MQYKSIFDSQSSNMTSNINEDSIMSRHKKKRINNKKNIEIFVENQNEKIKKTDESTINKADSLFEGENQLMESKLMNNTKFTDRVITSLDTSRFNVDVIHPRFDILDGLDSQFHEF